MKRWCPGCKQDLDIGRFSWRNKAQGTYQSYCKSCRAAQQRRITAEDPNGSRARWQAEHAPAAKRRYKIKLREEVMAIYGNKCQCCGTDYMPHLTIDHVDGNGNLERSTDAGSSSAKLYRRLRKLGVPDPAYQILCWNCNSAKHILGKCGCQAPSLSAESPLATP